MEPDKLTILQRALLPILEYMEAHESIHEERELLAAVALLLEWMREARAYPYDS